MASNLFCWLFCYIFVTNKVKNMNKLTFYFKSGQEVTIDKVNNWKVSSNGETVTSLSILQEKSAKRKLIVQSIDLNSIDCIIEN